MTVAVEAQNLKASMLNYLDKQDFRMARRDKVEGSLIADIGDQAACFSEM